MSIAKTDTETMQHQVKPGGDTTVDNSGPNAFSQPAANLSVTRREDFFIGNAFFQNSWVPAPSSTRAKDGLGPLFNTNSCEGCHVKDGRGRPPGSTTEPFKSILVRLSIPAQSETHRLQLIKKGAIPEPNYGGQLHERSIQGINPEAKASLNYQKIKGQFEDGEVYSLRKPKIIISDLQYGPLHPQLMTSVRVAPMMIGLGLLETIPELNITKNADPEDINGDGVSGRINIVWDIQQKKRSLGRFGWKAGQPNVRQQTAAAFNGDLGITSTLFPAQPCSKSQNNCQSVSHGEQPEISNQLLKFVTFYAKTLAVPARRSIESPEVKRGKYLFAHAGCAACHTPHFRTGEVNDFPELSRQYIAPYSDLLLHDMGEGLADNRPEFEATGTEWRTPPLWAIGLVQAVNGHTFFLHDGRARNLTEAILWHGGEAENSKDRFKAMNKKDREAVIKFLNSL